MRVVAEETVAPDRGAADPCPEEATYDDVRLAEDGLPGSCILTWSVPGTSVSNVSNITVHFDGSQAGYYDCERPAHGNVEPYLVVWQWEPRHEGMLTLGDNNKCSVDQGAGATNGSAGVHSPSGVVGPIRNDWVIGVAGGEIPWLGTVKLMVGGPDSYGTKDVPIVLLHCPLCRSRRRPARTASLRKRVSLVVEQVARTQPVGEARTRSGSIVARLLEGFVHREFPLTDEQSGRQ